VVWWILRGKREKSAPQSTELVSDTEELPKGEEPGKSENLVENIFVGTWRMMIGMWTEQVMLMRP
jgi:hypothetical protein